MILVGFFQLPSPAAFAPANIFQHHDMVFVLLSQALASTSTPDSRAPFKVIKKAKSIHWTLRILGDFKAMVSSQVVAKLPINRNRGFQKMAYSAALSPKKSHYYFLIMLFCCFSWM